MLCYSTLGLPAALSFEEHCRLVASHGFAGIEIALTPEQLARRSDAWFWREASGAATAAGLTITCLHLGNPALHPGGLQLPSFLSLEGERRSYWMKRVRSAFEIADRIACPRVAFASGLPREDLSCADSWTLFLESIAQLLPFKPPACRMLVEHEPEHFIATSADLIELYSRTGGEVGANLDVGHLEVSGEPLGAAIAALGSRIENVHLEDIKGRRHEHLMPGDGEIDFAEVGAALRSSGYKGPLTADLYPFADAPNEALTRARSAFGAILAA